MESVEEVNKTVPKYKTVRDPAEKQNLPPSRLQTALVLGRTILPLGDQGRIFRPVRFQLPTVDVAKKYLTDFKITEIEVDQSSLS